LIPLPNKGVHQRENAESLVNAGAAVSLSQGDVASRLAAEIVSLAADPARRSRMADAARAAGRPKAAEDIARDLLELAGIAPRVDGEGGTAPGAGSSATTSNSNSNPNANSNPSSTQVNHV
jgi:hypothetical protein